MSRIALARALSLIGHPGVVMPLALMVLSRQMGAAAQAALGVAVGITALVVLYSLWQVRRGAWAHVDASQRPERLQLNRFVAAVLLGSSALAWLNGALALGVGLAASGGLVLVALALQRWCKLSLHVGFACFAAGLMWPNAVALGFGALLAGGVAWSRLVLQRHVPRDLWVGAAVGSLAALLVHGVLPGLQ
ncbi:hypothetical protein [Ideonella paludis]|uniref:Phosphoesterase n=1 Tax=Ideonella paludis TaxID=1233411 RepID=A0ABS5DRW3_9BURK|nr:hypothetical protein [Ideonella paludis]MBQ0933874.1 hypothetical protein [Ideonella paludis]